MFIIGKASAEADGFDETTGWIDLTAQINARLFDIEADLFSFNIRVERIADRNAVKAVIMADRKAQIAVAGNHRGTACNFPRLAAAIGESA